MKQLLFICMCNLLALIVCTLGARIIHNFDSYDLRDDEFLYGTFPADFKFGFATASYQIEGAWNEDGKGQNIWDNFTHTDHSRIYDGSDGDIACDSYHRYEEDIQLLKNMGANYYRFSISWSRVLPNGTLEGGVNPAGLGYYNNLINQLLANGIEPMVTLYHWDLPQAIEDQGGFLNPEFYQFFGPYARLMFSQFGDRVKQWITFNEPWVQCQNGYANGVNAPGLRLPSTGGYTCGHNLLKAHAHAYHIYSEEFRTKQNGKVGITINTAWYEPEIPHDHAYKVASETALQFDHGWFGYPIVYGHYPPRMRKLIDFKSKQEGRNVSRLPEFDNYWSQRVKGSFDFLGLNHYTTRLTFPEDSNEPCWEHDQNVGTKFDPAWISSGSSWLRMVPWGFRKILNWIKNTYDNPLVFVTENGWSDGAEIGLNDTKRALYYKLYMNELLKAVSLDECNVKAYTAWSLMDNFEWARGYTERFGFHWVNFTDPTRPRIPKQSTGAMRKIIADHGFPAREDN